MSPSQARISSFKQVLELNVDPERRFHSATHAEIAAGATADLYFVKTMEILRHLHLDQTEVTAEIFATRSGVLAGISEALGLLAGSPVTVWGIPEGERFEEREVIMRLRGPYQAFGIYETAVLGMLAAASGWATATAEVVAAAAGKPVICFGARHVHPAVAPVMERAAIVGGAAGASCLLGAALAGRRPVGTVPHALILIVGDTLRVAQAYKQVMPADEPLTILVDTFADEAAEAVRVAAALESELSAVRLDTAAERGGVTPGLVQEVRARLDQAGFQHVRIFVSGGLNPDRIRNLSAAGADGFGVGSFIASAAPVDMTLDIKEVSGRAVAKRGRIPGLTANPRLQMLQAGTGARQ